MVKLLEITTKSLSNDTFILEKDTLNNEDKVLVFSSTAALNFFFVFNYFGPDCTSCVDLEQETLRSQPQY